MSMCQIMVRLSDPHNIHTGVLYFRFHLLVSKFLPRRPQSEVAEASLSTGTWSKEIRL